MYSPLDWHPIIVSDYWASTGEFVFIAYDQKDVKLSYLSEMRTKTRTTASTGAQIFNSINKKTWSVTIVLTVLR